MGICVDQRVDFHLSEDVISGDQYVGVLELCKESLYSYSMNEESSQ